MTYKNEAPDAALSYGEIKAGRILKAQCGAFDNRHPKPTKQGYDFYMTLGAFI